MPNSETPPPDPSAPPAPPGAVAHSNEAEGRGYFHRTCRKCGREGPISLFVSKGDGKKIYKFGTCKKCYSDRQREWKNTPERREYDRQYRLANKERIAARLKKWRQNNPRHQRKHKDWVLREQYGISIETFEKMSAEQDGRCAICRRAPHDTKSIKGLVVDHCHKSGVVRGLLCVNCNHGLGSFRDDTHSLRRAVAYLDSCALLSRAVEPPPPLKKVNWRVS